MALSKTLLLSAAGLFFCSTLAFSQDMRTVTEPRVPATCATLTARLASVSGSLAEADENSLDTARIQNAINQCAPGKAVELRSEGKNNAFLTGPLELKRGTTLLVSEGTTLFGSRNPRDYDLASGSCGIVSDSGPGCKPLIHVERAPEAAIMGNGVIDGRGYAKLLGQNVSWWDLAEQARKAGKQRCPRLVLAEQADNFILYGITLRNSPNFHVVVSRTNGFTAWGVKVDSPKTARNTDGIDPSSSTNVSILHSYIRAGDDNVAIKAGSNGPSTHMTIAHNHFYYGHGMSIGSETNGGASAIRVYDLTIDGADNGLRIKSDLSRGGLVRDVSYRDVCIRDVKHPIVMDPFYSKASGNKIPWFQEIVLQNVHIEGGGKSTLVGIDAQHSLDIQLDGVIADFRPEDVRAANARIAAGPGKVNFFIAGENVELKRLSGKPEAINCGGRFVPFPTGPAIQELQHSSADR